MIKQLPLGNNGPLTGRLGYGAMVLEGYYGASDDSTAVQALAKAIELGMLIDSADAYGAGHNESLAGQAIKAASSKPLVATKFGIVFDEGITGTELPTGWGFSLNINGTPEYAEKALDASLTRLGVDAVDLWYAHYPDPSVPVEETVGAMSKAVERGKVKYLGLSNVTEDDVRRAHAVHPISAVQYEYSLWRREAETELLPTLRELGIALVGWSPLGGGLLTGTVRSLDEGDFRHNNPRYSGDNLKLNRERFSPLIDIADSLHISPAQLALAWILHQGEDIFPIPGSRKPERLEENAAAVDVVLDQSVLDEISRIAAPGTAVGATLV